MEKDPVLKSPAASALIGVAESTLAKMRCYGGGPVFIKQGKSVGYRLSDLNAYVAAHAVTSTSDRSSNGRKK